MYIVNDYQCGSVFWNCTDGEKVNRFNAMFDQLVPESGESATDHGEILRMSNRLTFDIFNNGLCNDKLPEINHLQEKLALLSPYFPSEEMFDAAKALLDELEAEHIKRDEAEHSKNTESEWVEGEWYEDDDGEWVQEDGYYDDVEVDVEYDPGIPVFGQERCDALDSIVWAAVLHCEQFELEAA